VTGVIGLEVPYRRTARGHRHRERGGDQGAEVFDVIINYESSAVATLEGSS